MGEQEYEFKTNEEASTDLLRLPLAHGDGPALEIAQIRQKLHLQVHLHLLLTPKPWPPEAGQRGSILQNYWMHALLRHGPYAITSTVPRQPTAWRCWTQNPKCRGVVSAASPHR